MIYASHEKEDFQNYKIMVVWYCILPLEENTIERFNTTAKI